MKYQARCSGVAIITLALAACGGGGSSTSTSSASAPSASSPINVALEANGASVSASYGGPTANFVNDGDSATTTNFWAGNVTDDYVAIDFGRLRNVSEITVFTNDTSFSSSDPAKYIEVSADGSAWKTTAQAFGGDISCTTYVAGSGKIRCVFPSAQSIRYFRVRVTAVSPAAEQIVEMEAMGH